MISNHGWLTIGSSLPWAVLRLNRGWRKRREGHTLRRWCCRVAGSLGVNKGGWGGDGKCGGARGHGYWIPYRLFKSYERFWGHQGWEIWYRLWWVSTYLSCYLCSWFVILEGFWLFCNGQWRWCSLKVGDGEPPIPLHVDSVMTWLVG